jgi:type III secretion system FlhB-like substrate exporter
MSNLLDLILANIDKATLIVLALAGLLTTVIVQYKKLRKLLAEKDLAEIIAPISSEADTKPANILNSLINKPLSLDSTAQHVSTGHINSNEGKALIVAAKAYEVTKSEKPKLLKKLGINNVSDMIPIVSTVYQAIVKPIIKRH